MLTRDFQARCNAAGVVKCVGFDAPGDFRGGLVNPSADGRTRPVMDRTIVASGSGSLRFEIPSRSPANSSGYWADYTQVFIGLATAAGLPVREWGLEFDGFGGDGHAIVGTYDESRAQWLMLDPFNWLYPANAVTGQPMSVLELGARLATPDPLATTRFVRIVPAAFGFRDDANLVEYSQRGIDQFYRWWGSNVFSYERQQLVAAAGRVSRSAEQLAGIVTGVHPGIRI